MSGLQRLFWSLCSPVVDTWSCLLPLQLWNNTFQLWGVEGYIWGITKLLFLQQHCWCWSYFHTQCIPRQEKKKKLRRGCSATNGTACTPEHLGKCVWSCVVAEGTTTVVDGKAGPAWVIVVTLRKPLKDVKNLQSVPVPGHWGKKT